MRICVVGATGYAGGEILRLLAAHPKYFTEEITISHLMGNSNTGETLETYQPQFIGHPVGKIKVTPTNIDELNNVNLIFMALPHGQSANLAAQIKDTIKIIDAGADHRIENPEVFTHYYGNEHTGNWPYGIPEIPGQRKIIEQSTRVAVPGCFPTAAILGLVPVIKHVIPQIVVNAVTGTSGAGKTADTKFSHSEIHSNAFAYNVAGKHRHTAEMEEQLTKVAGKEVIINFTPILIPTTRGILANIQTLTDLNESEIQDLFHQAYDHEPFIHILNEPPQLKNIIGTNNIHIYPTLDAKRKTIQIVVTIDNLTKGTSGAAIQNMNLICGYPETMGLTKTGVTPC